MRDDLIRIVDDIRANSDLDSYDEIMTKQAVIVRLLVVLGWNQYHPDEVKAEYSTSGKRVDYSLRLNGINKVFIEVKQTCDTLVAGEEQLLNYAFLEGVKLAVLTNGITWQFYLPMYEVVCTERKFCTADLRQQETAVFADKLNELLSRANVESGEAVSNAERMLFSLSRRRIVMATIPTVWNQIVEKPDERLTGLLKETVESSCGFAVEDGVIEGFILQHLTRITVTNDPQMVAAAPAPKQVPVPTSTAQRYGTNKGVDFKKECITRVEARLQQSLPVQTNSRRYTADRNKIGVRCACASVHTRPNCKYWFTFHHVDERSLRGVAEGYLALGCGSEQYVLLIPLVDLVPLLPRLYRTEKTPEREGWDLCIRSSQGKWSLLMKDPEPPTDITRYLI